MVILGGWVFLMSEVHLADERVLDVEGDGREVAGRAEDDVLEERDQHDGDARRRDLRQRRQIPPWW